MRYIFKIDKDKELLLADEQNAKLHEMKVTCDEFTAVLGDLAKMGLKINLRNEKPIELNSIITISKTENSRIRKIIPTQQVQSQLRKKYLS